MVGTLVKPSVQNSGFIAGGNDDGSVILWKWILDTADDTGQGVAMPEWADCTIHAYADPNGVGNPDSWGGATLTWQGANADSDVLYDTLSNAAGGTAATWSADGVKSIIELPVFMRPKLTAVGAGARVTVTLLKRRANPLRQ